MAKYFLGSVGEAIAEEVIMDELTGEVHAVNLAFTSKTITDSAVNVSIQREDIIDSYNGAPAGVFYHSPNLTITLSDVLWQPKFLEYTLGQKFSELADEGNTEYCTVKLTLTNKGVAYLDLDEYRAPRPVDFPGAESDYYLVVGKRLGESDWHEFNCVKDTANNRFIFGKIGSATDPEPARNQLVPDKEYCFRYLATSIRSKELMITTKIIPAELRLTITTPLFLAEGCADGDESNYISKSKHAGYLVYEVPRWSLNADLSLSATMSGTNGMQLVGTVLEAIDNEEASPMMRIKEFIAPRAWWEGLVDLYWASSTPIEPGHYYFDNIYGLYADGRCELITSTVDDPKLAFTGLHGICDPNDEKRGIDGELYNVTGVFNTGLGARTVKVYPGVMQSDDDGHRYFVALENICCVLQSGD